MSDNQTILINFLRTDDALKIKFNYKDIFKIATDTLDVTYSGETYATLKFLQKFCNPLKVEISKISDFKTGDPRDFYDLESVKNEWEYKIAKEIKIADVKSIIKTMAIE